MKNKFVPTARAIDREAARMARRVWWVDQEDLRQEAWLEVLGLKRLDWKKPARAEGYIRSVARARMGRFCWRESAPVTISKQHGSEKRTAEGLHRTSLSQSDAAAACVHRRTPELEAIENEALRAEKRLRAELRLRMAELARGSVSVDAVLFVLLDGLEPKVAAQKARVPVQPVCKDATRVKREAVADQVIRNILFELLEARSDLTC
jgi:hypothetical protein